MPLEPDSHAAAQHAMGADVLAPRKALLIVNPNSRRGGETDLVAVTKRLEGSGFEIIQRESRSAEECARDLDRYCDEVDVVIVAGGDGTVSSVASSVYRHKKPLAILPLGTANDLARSLSIPEDLLAAGQLVVENTLRHVDLGLVNGHYFFNAVNIGLGTEVTHHLTKEVKRTWGVFSYLRTLKDTLSRKKSFRVWISVDGRTYRQRSIHITVGNGRYYGGGNVIDENAEIDSGMLCLYSIRPQPLWKLVWLAPLLRFGKQRLASQTFTASGVRVEITTTRPLEVHADGELVTHTPAKLEIIPRALAVYAPPRSTSMVESRTELHPREH